MSTADVAVGRCSLIRASRDQRTQVLSGKCLDDLSGHPLCVCVVLNHPRSARVGVCGCCAASRIADPLDDGACMPMASSLHRGNATHRETVPILSVPVMEGMASRPRHTIQSSAGADDCQGTQGHVGGADIQTSPPSIRIPVCRVSD